MRGFLPFLGPGEGFSRYSSHFWELWMRGFLNTLAILWEWIGLDILAIFGGLMREFLNILAILGEWMRKFLYFLVILGD